MHSRLTASEKSQVPTSLLEKLECDENNPDRENYKPGYILLYLIYYLLVELILTMNVLVGPMWPYGMEIMLIFTLVYLVIVWKWSPYQWAVNFHNKALRLNHLVAFAFVVVCEILNRADVPP